jgi:alpha-tubulin suppressor-like RCC1 family protein
MKLNADPTKKEYEHSDDEICSVTAGMNHNLALTYAGKVLSWGYNGYNITGRK